ncbi:MAG TPA: SRPBCC family protein [Anaerolineae bacterium]|nr:SRPBCC family protein [Anaerolineae bacterium]
MADQITKSIIVDGSVSDVFGLWANFQNFPHFMKYVKSVVPTSERTSRWVVEGPLGKDVEWEAEITKLEPNRRIGWSTKDRKDDSNVTTSGQVTFAELGTKQTEVTVMMQYVAPAGAVGEVVAKLFANPEQRVSEDLNNFKRFAEGDLSRLKSI